MVYLANAVIVCLQKIKASAVGLWGLLEWWGQKPQCVMSFSCVFGSQRIGLWFFAKCVNLELVVNMLFGDGVLLIKRDLSLSHRSSKNV